MSLSNESTLKLSSKIVCAPSYERLLHTKLSRLLLHYMMPLIKQDPKAEGVFDFETIRDDLNYRDCRLEMLTRDLEKYVIDWEDVIPGAIKWGSTYLFEKCSLNYHGDIVVAINPELVPEIVTPRSYKILNMRKLLSFKSHYALRLYEFANQYFIEKENFGRTPNLLNDALRKLLGCDAHDYPRAYDFIKNAVILPLKEVRELTQLHISLRHDRRHIYSRRYWLEISDMELPGDPSGDEPSSSESEYTYLIQRLAAYVNKHKNIPRALFDDVVKNLDDQMRGKKD